MSPGRGLGRDPPTSHQILPPRAPTWSQKGTKMEPKRMQRAPKGEPKGCKMEPNGGQLKPTGYQKGTKASPKCISKSMDAFSDRFGWPQAAQVHYSLDHFGSHLPSKMYSKINGKIYTEKDVFFNYLSSPKHP